MNDQEFLKMCDKAITKWGVPAQLRMITEELAELIVAISKFGRKNNGSTMDQVCDEIADVDVMLAQLKAVLKNLGHDVDYKIDMYRQAKLIRLKSMLEDA